MLTQELDRETERYLADILAQEKTTSDALIRQLIRDRWLSLHPEKEAPMQPKLPHAEFLQSEFPQPSLQPTSVSSSTPQSRPKSSKQLIADFVRRKSGRPL